MSKPAVPGGLPDPEEVRPLTPAEQLYGDIIRLPRPEDPDVFRRHPRMSPENRAKIFAPFAALRGHGERLSQEDGRLLRQHRPVRSEDENRMLSEALLQVKKGMDLTVTHFLPDGTGGDLGYCVTSAGRVSAIDFAFRQLKLTPHRDKNALTGQDPLAAVTPDLVLSLDDILSLEGEGIVNLWEDPAAPAPPWDGAE